MSKSAVEALLDSAGPAPTPAPAAEPPEDFKPPMPKTKGEVGKLSTEQMDMLVEAHGLAMPGEWHEASTAEKHKILNVALGFVASKKGKNGAPPKGGAQIAVVEPDPDNLAILEGDEDAPLEAAKAKPAAAAALELDPITKASHEIEALTDQAAIEAAIGTRLTNTGLDRFYLGGMLTRLLEVGSFDDNTSFKEHIASKWGLKYRSARNYITLYNDLLKSNIPWETVSALGWSKVQILLNGNILTADNAAEWVEKAKQYNSDTLEAAIKAATNAAVAAGDGSVVPQDEHLQASKLKTFTCGLGPDQEELVNEALADAMKKGQTEHKGVALELICTEYLGSQSGMKPTSKPQPLPAANLDDILAQAYEPKAIFSYFLTQAKGDKAAALSALFTEAFDEVFPNVDVKLDIKKG